MLIHNVATKVGAEHGAKVGSFAPSPSLKRPLESSVNITCDMMNCCSKWNKLVNDWQWWRRFRCLSCVPSWMSLVQLRSGCCKTYDPLLKVIAFFWPPALMGWLCQVIAAKSLFLTSFSVCRFYLPQEWTTTSITTERRCHSTTLTLAGLPFDHHHCRLTPPVSY